MALRRYIAKRVSQAIFVVWLVVTAIFAMIRMTPGDPVTAVVGLETSPEVRQAVREQLGLGKPLHVQYIDWLADLLRGDLGESFLKGGQPVTDLIFQSLQPTLSIGLFALVFAFGIGIPAGIISAVRKESAFDYSATIVAFLGISMPAFWIGILLIVFVSANVDWIPVFGYADPGNEGFVAWFTHLVLPALAVGLPNGGILMRFTRDSMLEVLNQEYMRTAKAKGLSRNVVLFKHGLQNGLIPVVTVIGIMLGALFAGVVAVEIVFGYNGMGRLLISAIHQNDYPVVQGIMILVAGWFVFMNLFIDLLYSVINPQIRYGERG